jgi:hypothetical protein
VKINWVLLDENNFPVPRQNFIHQIVHLPITRIELAEKQDISKLLIACQNKIKTAYAEDILIRGGFHLDAGEYV